MKVKVEKRLCGTWNFHWSRPHPSVPVIHVGSRSRPFHFDSECIGFKSHEKTITRNIVRELSLGVHNWHKQSCGKTSTCYKIRDWSDSPQTDERCLQGRAEGLLLLLM